MADVPLVYSIIFFCIILLSGGKNSYLCRPLKFKDMAVTRLKRKSRRNKTTAELKKQYRKLLVTVPNVESPYKGKSGVIIEDEKEK